MPVSARQSALLARLKLPVPSDSIAASRLLDFALHGNNSRGRDAKHRRALIRAYWQRWVSKVVQIVQDHHPFRGVCGRVEYLLARTPDEATAIVTSRLAKNPLPFIAVIRIFSVKTNALVESHLTGLKLIRGEAVQPRLFS